MKAVSEETKLDRRKMTLSASKLITNCTRKRKNTLKSTMSSHNVAFLERDDNSRIMPGKNDFKTVREDDGLVKEKRQKQILNDYLKNLHEKYLAEYPERKISVAMFVVLDPPIFFLLILLHEMFVCAQDIKILL